MTQIRSTNTNAVHNLLGNLTGVYSSFASAGSSNPTPAGAFTPTVAFRQTAHNYQLDIEAVNSKLSDITTVPPTLSSMGDNNVFEYDNASHAVYLVKKQITHEYKRILTVYFNMFGYKTNEVKVPNLRTRQNRNYVQTKGCIIQGDFNNDDLNTIKRIFDNGSTLWHTDDIGNYSLSNWVR